MASRVLVQCYTWTLVVVRRAQRGEPAGGCLRRRPATSGLDTAEDRRAGALGRATLRHLQDIAGQQRLRLQDPRQVGCNIACSAPCARAFLPGSRRTQVRVFSHNQMSHVRSEGRSTRDPGWNERDMFALVERRPSGESLVAGCVVMQCPNVGLSTTTKEVELNLSLS